MVLLLDGVVELDEGLFELRRDGAAIPLEPQAFDVLVHLVRHRDRVVAKEELMDTIWGGRFVSETAVTSRIKQVRRALGDDGQAQRFVRTYHGRGYRFVANLEQPEEVAEPAPSGPAAAPSANGSEAPELSWGHVRLQLTGQGPPDLVLLPPVADLAGEWQRPDRAALLTSLSRLGRVIRFASPAGPRDLADG